MRLKIDENIHPVIAADLRSKGHDVHTVADEGLRGVADRDLLSHCEDERRALMTLDKDFADIRNYPPEKFHGLIVFRLSSQSRRHVRDVVRRLEHVINSIDLTGRLWVVDDDGVRVRGGEPGKDALI